MNKTIKYTLFTLFTPKGFYGILNILLIILFALIPLIGYGFKWSNNSELVSYSSQVISTMVFETISTIGMWAKSNRVQKLQCIGVDINVVFKTIMAIIICGSLPTITNFLIEKQWSYCFNCLLIISVLFTCWNASLLITSTKIRSLKTWMFMCTLMCFPLVLLISLSEKKELEYLSIITLINDLKFYISVPIYTSLSIMFIIIGISLNKKTTQTNWARWNK